MLWSGFACLSICWGYECSNNCVLQCTFALEKCSVCHLHLNEHQIHKKYLVSKKVAGSVMCIIKRKNISLICRLQGQEKYKNQYNQNLYKDQSLYVLCIVNVMSVEPFIDLLMSVSKRGLNLWETYSI